MSPSEISAGASPAPRTTLSALIKCTACDVENRAERQYCASCGARLWEPCLRCGQTNAAVEKHCGACGAHLADALQHAQAELESRLAECELFAAEYRHASAIEVIQAAQIADHSGLTRYRRQISERTDSLSADLARVESDRKTAIASGRALCAQFNYEQAAITLERIPDACRTDELRQLLDEVRGRQIDMLTLVAEIRRAVAENRTDGLLDKVESLLVINPDHQQARALADKLRPLEDKKKLIQRNALYQSAKAHLAKHDYAAALECLRQIPETLRTQRLVKLIDDTQAKAAEVAWLARDLHEAVVYDEHLLVAAERLSKLQPNDAEANKLCKRLREMARLSDSPPNDKAAWPTSPANSRWGPPLETVRGFRHIDASSLDDVGFKKGPDRFCVAAGLALQGLHRGLLNVNLAPPDKGAGLFGLLRSKKKPLTAWGIDVGRAALKAIRLRYVPDEDRIIADAVECIEHDNILNAPEVEAEALLNESLDKLLARADLSDSRLCVSLPAQKVLYRPIAFPLVDEKKMADLMRFEVKQRIPLPADTMVWGHQVLSDRQTDGDAAAQCDIALLALKLDESQAAIAPFQKRGLKVDVLTSDAAALFNFVSFENSDSLSLPGRGRGEGQSSRGDSHSQAPPGNAPLPVTAILDVGTDTSNVIVTDRRALLMRAIPLGGNSFSRAIVNEFQFTFAHAEKVKRDPLAISDFCRLYAAVEPRLDDLIRELLRSIDGFLQAAPARRMARFVVVGQGLKLHAALRRLWRGEP